MWTRDDRESQAEGASSTKVLRKKWAGGLGKQPGCRKAREASRRARLTGERGQMGQEEAADRICPCRSRGDLALL